MEQLSWLADEATSFASTIALDETGRWRWRVAWRTLERSHRDEWVACGTSASVRDAVESLTEAICEARLRTY